MKTAALIFGTALAVRAGLGLVWAARAVDPQALSFPDEVQYWLMAQSLAAGDGLRDELGFRATRMPVYPSLLALFTQSPNGVWGIRVLQWILGAATAAMLGAWVTSLGHDRRVGAWAGFLTAFDPFLAFFSSLLLTETIFTFWTVLWGIALWPLVREDDKKVPVKKWFAMGLMSAVGIYTRESALVLLVLAGLFTVLVRKDKRRTIGGGLIAGSLVFLSLVPWAVRNRSVAETSCFLTTRGGISLYDGVGPQATGASDLGGVKQMPSVVGLSEADWDRYFRSESWKAIAGDPWRIVRLAGIKLSRTWNVVPNFETYRSPKVLVVAALWTIPTFVLAILGVWYLVRNGSPALANEGGSGIRMAWFLLLPALYVSVLHSLFVGSVRYRIAAIPFLHVLAAAAAVTIWTRLRGGQYPGDA